MSEEIKKKMLMVSAILYKSNVPIEEAKIIGHFIEQLQQENQQLKEELNKYKRIYRENPTLYDEIAPYIINECNLENKLKQYKSVLDEIREYIKEKAKEDEECVDIRYINFGEGVDYDLLKILDKVRGE